jgi:hypothetical protein
MDLSLLVQGGSGRPPIDSLRTRTRPPRFLDRLGPGAMQLHDLRAMHLAGAGEGDHVGLAMAPLREGGCPFAGSIERIDLLTGTDHTAVHQARHEWRQLTRGNGDHGLVQECESGVHVPLLKSYAALLVTGTGDQVRVAAALTDPDGVGRSSVCGIEVTGCEVLFYERQQQVTPLGALACDLVQQALRARKPTAGASRLATHEQTKTKPECAANRATALTDVQMRVVGTLECSEVFIVPTDEVRRHGQQLEVFRIQRGFLVGEQQCVVRIVPRARPKVLTGMLQLFVSASAPRFQLALMLLLHRGCSSMKRPW